MGEDRVAAVPALLHIQHHCGITFHLDGQDFDPVTIPTPEDEINPIFQHLAELFADFARENIRGGDFSKSLRHLCNTLYQYTLGSPDCDEIRNHLYGRPDPSCILIGPLPLSLLYGEGRFLGSRFALGTVSARRARTPDVVLLPKRPRILLLNTVDPSGDVENLARYLSDFGTVEAYCKLGIGKAVEILGDDYDIIVLKVHGGWGDRIRSPFLEFADQQCLRGRLLRSALRQPSIVVSVFCSDHPAHARAIADIFSEKAPVVITPALGRIRQAFVQGRFEQFLGSLLENGGLVGPACSSQFEDWIEEGFIVVPHGHPKTRIVRPATTDNDEFFSSPLAKRLTPSCQTHLVQALPYGIYGFVRKFLGEPSFSETIQSFGVSDGQLKAACDAFHTNPPDTDWILQALERLAKKVDAPSISDEHITALLLVMTGVLPLSLALTGFGESTFTADDIRFLAGHRFVGLTGLPARPSYRRVSAPSEETSLERLDLSLPEPKVYPHPSMQGRSASRIIQFLPDEKLALKEQRALDLATSDKAIKDLVLIVKDPQQYLSERIAALGALCKRFIEIEEGLRIELIEILKELLHPNAKEALWPLARECLERLGMKPDEDQNHG